MSRRNWQISAGAVLAAVLIAAAVWRSGGSRQVDQASSSTAAPSADTSRGTSVSNDQGQASSTSNPDRRVGASSNAVGVGQVRRMEPPQEETAPSQAPGQPVSARVTLKGQPRDLSPSQSGTFERLMIEAGQTIPVELSYPKAQPGQKVTVSVEDGGALDEEKPVQILPLDEQRQVRFNFTAGTHLGIYRVTLRQGRDVKTFQAWVGPALLTVQD